MHFLRVGGGLVLATAVASSALAQQTFFPAPVPPAGNPITQQKALLGMALFWEEQLSTSNTIACGTCHAFSRGGVDPRAGTRAHPGADGVFGTADDVQGAIGVPALDRNGRHVDDPHFGVNSQVTSRKAPTVINAGYLPSLFYDGRARNGDFLDPVTQQVVLTGNTALENLVALPPLNTIEMGHPGRTWTEIAAKIATARPLALASNIPSRLATFVNGATTYQPLFEAAYGPGATVTPTRIIMAIATYIRTLVSDQSRYDRHLAGQGTLSASEQAGLAVFNAQHGAASSCVRCHGDIAAASHQHGPSPISTTMYGHLPVPNSHNTGVRPIGDDRGVGGITNNTSDMGRFRAPGLRNTELHGTWFHTSGVATLDAVVEFYDRGGDFFVNQATEIEPRNLPAQDKANLVAFLRTLTDPRVAQELPPFDRPRLGSEQNNLPTLFGTGMTGSHGLAATTVANLPVFVGSRDVAIAVDNAPANSAAVLMFDLVAEPQGFTYAGVQLYLGLYEFAANYVGQTNARANGSGVASFAFDIPQNPGLAGLRVYTQWLMLDQQGGLTTSNAAEILVR